MIARVPANCLAAVGLQASALLLAGRNLSQENYPLTAVVSLTANQFALFVGHDRVVCNDLYDLWDQDGLRSPSLIRGLRER